MKQFMPLARAMAYILYVAVFWIIIRSPPPPTFLPLFHDCATDMLVWYVRTWHSMTITAILTEVPMYTSIIIFLYLFRV